MKLPKKKLSHEIFLRQIFLNIFLISNIRNRTICPIRKLIITENSRNIGTDGKHLQKQKKKHKNKNKNKDENKDEYKDKKNIGNRNQSDYMIRNKKRQIKINNKILE